MGVASGVGALDSAAVKRLSLAGTPAIFVRRETVTTGIEGHGSGRRHPDRFRRPNLARRGGSAPTGQGLPRCLSRPGN